MGMSRKFPELIGGGVKIARYIWYRCGKVLVGAAGLADGGEDVVGDSRLELLGLWFAGGDVGGVKAGLISLRRRTLVPVRRRARRVSRVTGSS